MNALLHSRDNNSVLGLRRLKLENEKLVLLILTAIQFTTNLDFLIITAAGAAIYARHAHQPGPVQCAWLRPMPLRRG